MNIFIKFKFSLTGILSILYLSSYSQYINPGIVLTFDDCYINNWHELLPIFEKYNTKATFFVTTPNAIDSVEKVKIQDLYNAGNEIGSHSFHHYNSVNYIDTSSINTYVTDDILSSINWFDTVLNISISTFAYPYGARNASIDNELYKYFKILRGTDYSLTSLRNKITNLSYSRLVYGVGIDDAYNNSIEDIKMELLRCKDDSMIQIFYSHKPTKKVNGKYEILYSKLDSILSYANRIGLKFYTTNQIYIPPAEIELGDTIIYDTTKISDFYINSFEYDIDYIFKPEKAGVVTILDSVIRINWNNSFKGDCSLKVAYSNNCGQGNFSKESLIKYVPIVDVDYRYLKSINLYPNPSNGLINISFDINSKHENKTIYVFNNIGQMIKKADSFNINTSSLLIDREGIYYIKIVSDFHVYTQRVIIN